MFRFSVSFSVLFETRREEAHFNLVLFLREEQGERTEVRPKASTALAGRFSPSLLRAPVACLLLSSQRRVGLLAVLKNEKPSLTHIPPIMCYLSHACSDHGAPTQRKDPARPKISPSSSQQNPTGLTKSG